MPCLLPPCGKEASCSPGLRDSHTVIAPNPVIRTENNSTSVQPMDLRAVGFCQIPDVRSGQYRRKLESANRTRWYGSCNPKSWRASSDYRIADDHAGQWVRAMHIVKVVTRRGRIPSYGSPCRLRFTYINIRARACVDLPIIRAVMKGTQQQLLRFGASRSYGEAHCHIEVCMFGSHFVICITKPRTTMLMQDSRTMT